MFVKPRWDIFCQVVDNFGDIGVCWRLARQLSGEYGVAVRLWCDDLAALARLNPATDPALATQVVDGIEICLWDYNFPTVACADVVIEAFACELPAAYLKAMAERERPPVWINLEYLSAEDWVGDCHLGASPHPRLPLLKYFFFPGFTNATGGLLRETDLLAKRDRQQNDPVQCWSAIGVPPSRPDEINISLFCYPNAALPKLIESWVNSTPPVRCLVPQGHSLKQVASIIDAGELRCGEARQRGSLRVQALPFVAQERFDQLLWACDINFVRGEDSFVRAQWAARPFVWHIYPQEDAAHRIKLSAFLDRYCADMPAAAADACRDFWEHCNHGEATDWPLFVQHRTTLESHARQWARQLAAQVDLAENLVNFAQSRL
jgi:uncharacterized repeat protein (TIGR03837 family)